MFWRIVSLHYLFPDRDNHIFISFKSEFLWKSYVKIILVTSMTFFSFDLLYMNYSAWKMCLYKIIVVNTFRSFPHSWLITDFVKKLTRRLPLVEQELLTFPDHLSSSQVFSGVRVARSLVLCVMFCRSLFVLLSLFFCLLCYLSFLDLWILITPLVSSNSSYLQLTLYHIQ
jgi:hypothetical protein